MGALLLALAKYTSRLVIYLTEEIQWTYWLNDRAIQHFSAMNQYDSQETDHLREDCLFCPFSEMKITMLMQNSWFEKKSAKVNKQSVLLICYTQFSWIWELKNEMYAPKMAAFFNSLEFLHYEHW